MTHVTGPTGSGIQLGLFLFLPIRPLSCNNWVALRLTVGLTRRSLSSTPVYVCTDGPPYWLVVSNTVWLPKMSKLILKVFNVILKLSKPSPFSILTHARPVWSVQPVGCHSQLRSFTHVESCSSHSSVGFSYIIYSIHNDKPQLNIINETIKL